jgi:molybdate transport system regulatory protein
MKVWVHFGPRTKLGEGRVRLLELIDQHGSINKAVAELEMSYRNAWGYIRELEHAAGFRFVDRRPGGGSAGGAELTPEARRFLRRYRAFRTSLDDVVTRSFTAAFGGRGVRSGVRKGRPRRS